MKNLANVAVAVPFGLAEAWGGYFWYALGPSSKNADIFQGRPSVGTWVERGDSIYTLKGNRASMRSPISGLVISSNLPNLMIQPFNGFSLSEDDGFFMFREIIEFGYHIESEIAKFDEMSVLEKLWNTFRGKPADTPFVNVKDLRGYDSAKMLEGLSKLAEAECTIHPLDS
jgi:hypothetical protein